MSAVDHTNDPSFDAVAQEIGQAASNLIYSLLTAASGKHEALTGHEHCLHARILRGLVANEIVDVALHIADEDKRAPDEVLPALLVEHATLLTREARALLNFLVAEAAAQPESAHALH